MTQLRAASELLAAQGAIVAEWRKHKKTLVGPYYRVRFFIFDMPAQPVSDLLRSIARSNSVLWHFKKEKIMATHARPWKNRLFDPKKILPFFKNKIPNPC
jgi:hypothetical protein